MEVRNLDCSADDSVSSPLSWSNCYYEDKVLPENSFYKTLDHSIMNKYSITSYPLEPVYILYDECRHTAIECSICITLIFLILHTNYHVLIGGGEKGSRQNPTTVTVPL